MKSNENAIQKRAEESIGARIRRQRRRLGLSQEQLAVTSGVNQGYISQIERDKVQPRKRTIDALAVALSLPQGVLIGGGQDHDAPQPLDTRELPLLGTIPAGPPSQSQEQLEMFPVLRHQWGGGPASLKLSVERGEPTHKPAPPPPAHHQPARAPARRPPGPPPHYCLKLSIDSMEPTLKPGDIVLVHYRPDVDPEHVQGRICACLLDGLPTLKRVTVEYRPSGERMILLRGDNPRAQPMLVDKDRDFSIQGIVLRLVSREL